MLDFTFISNFKVFLVDFICRVRFHCILVLRNIPKIASDLRISLRICIFKSISSWEKI